MLLSLLLDPTAEPLSMLWQQICSMSELVVHFRVFCCWVLHIKVQISTIQSQASKLSARCEASAACWGLVYI